MSNACAGRRAGDELERFLIEAVHRLRRRRAVEAAAGRRRSARSSVRRSSRRSSVRPWARLRFCTREVRRVGIAAGLERVVLGAEHVAAEVAGGQADAVDVGHADVGGHAAAARRRPRATTMAPMPGNFCSLLAPLTPMSLVVSMRWPPAKWSPVSWCSERTIENLSVMLGLLGEQLGDVEAGHARADRPPDAAVLLRGVGLHVVEVHVAGTAVEPDEDDRGVARAAGAGAIGAGLRARRGRPRLAMPATPSCRKLRRFMPSQ